jgi:hypothetical protein
MRGVEYRNGRFIPPFSGFFPGHFLDDFPAIFSHFFVSLQHYRPSLALFASFISTLGVAVLKGN